MNNLLPGGTREVQLVGDSEDVPQMAELHPASLNGDVENGNGNAGGESPHVLQRTQESLSPRLRGAVDSGHFTRLSAFVILIEL